VPSLMHRRRVLRDRITYVGLDVHKDRIAVAVAEGGRRGEVREYGRIAHTPAAAAAWSPRTGLSQSHRPHRSAVYGDRRICAAHERGVCPKTAELMGRRRALPAGTSLTAPQPGNRLGASQTRPGGAPMPTSKGKAANRRNSPLPGTAAWARQITERD
jgi:hypothetical protein